MRKLALALLVTAGCVAQSSTLPPPPPPRAEPAPAPAPAPAPPPRPALISESQAVRIAAEFARSRGADVQRYRAKMDGRQRWHVEMREARGGGDRAKVLIDARDGRVLKAKLKKTDPDWDWDD